MPPGITFCGFRCDLCPAFAGNIRNRGDLTVIRLAWKRYFGFDVPEEKITCDGCRNEGRHADADCPVRPCAIGRGMESCADCPDFGCEGLRSRMEFAEKALAGREHVPQADFEAYFRPYLSRRRLEDVRKQAGPDRGAKPADGSSATIDS
jgi:hypothetical protein